VLVQVASSSSPELTDLETQVTKITMRINSKYSTLTHQPLVLLKQDISFTQFLALMSVAEVFMITSLREGMNLSGHDFVICQDGNSGISQMHGTLILSEFTGSASIWKGYEFLINPWDYVQCADAINRALVKPLEEKKNNWRFLTDRMAQHTASIWCDTFLEALRHAYDVQAERKLDKIPPLSMDTVREKYKKTNTRVFIIEDQSMFPSLPEHKESMTASDIERLSMLRTLSSDPKNIVYVTSSQTPKQLESKLGEISSIGFIAENGAFLREPREAKWQQLLGEGDTRNWRWGVHKVMEYFQERTEGASIEEQHFSLTFRYKDAVDQELADRQAADLEEQINSSRGNIPIRAVQTDGAVTIESTDVTEATAAELALRRITSLNFKPDLLFIAGNSHATEALFRWANRVEQEGRVPNVINVEMDTAQEGIAGVAVLNDKTSLIAELASLAGGCESFK
jgi:trehalose-phosphatase